MNTFEASKSNDFDAWADTFKPIENLDDGQGVFIDDICITFDRHSDRVKRVNNDYLWTVIECESEDDEIVDDSLWVICAGFHYVNAIGYIITRKPHTDTPLEEVVYG